MLKNLSMLNIRKVTVTDMDKVARSNLNRQLLFRECDTVIGKEHYKSKAGIKAVEAMNPDIKGHFSGHIWPVDYANRKHFDSKFFQGKTAIINALDNVEARVSTMKFGIEFQIPVLDSGTGGLEGSYNPFIPQLTRTYEPNNSRSAQQSGPKLQICMEHYFPSVPEHAIFWAKNRFVELFTDISGSLDYCFRCIIQHNHSYSELVKQNYDSSVITQYCKNLKISYRFLQRLNKLTFSDFIQLSRDLFEEYFTIEPANLFKEHPAEDNSFWGEFRRKPTILSYAPTEDEINFVTSMASLYADIFGIAKEEIPLEIISQLKATPGIQVILSDAGLREDHRHSLDEIKPDTPELLAMMEEHIREKLNGIKKINKKVFDKDSTTDRSMDWIEAASRIRQRQYDLDLTDRLEIKRIAGNISPALATTTAAVVGGALFEFFKICTPEKRTIENFHQGILNLGTNFFYFAMSQEPLLFTVSDNHENEICRFNEWDNWIIHGKNDMTVGEFVKKYFDTFHIKIYTMVMDGKCIASNEEELLKIADQKITELGYQGNTNFPFIGIANLIPRDEIHIVNVQGLKDYIGLPVCKLYLDL